MRMGLYFMSVAHQKIMAVPMMQHGVKPKWTAGFTIFYISGAHDQ